MPLGIPRSRWYASHSDHGGRGAGSPETHVDESQDIFSMMLLGFLLGGFASYPGHWVGQVGPQEALDG